MQIKKSASLFLAVLLLISNFGLAFNVHYCGDKIASISSTISTLDSKAECCCVNEKSEKADCCKDKVVDFKKETKEVVLKSISFQIDAPFVIVKSTEIIFAKAEKLISAAVIPDYLCVSNAPPLFKLFHQFVFYA